jgi:hypothetical protein
MAKITSTIDNKVKELKLSLKSNLELALRERAQVTLEKLKISATGTGRTARLQAPSQNPGTGLDVPFTTLQPNAIGNITGELRRRLQAVVKIGRSKVVAEIGFGKEIQALPGAAANALKQEAPTINVQPLNSPGYDPLPTEPPEKYIPWVILGTKTLVGRNILRLALYNDIMNQESLTAIKRQLYSLFSRQ